MRKLLQAWLDRTPYVVWNRENRRGVNALDDVQWVLREVESPVLFDVGANRGQTVTQLRARWPRAPIHAFEPAAETYALLRGSVGQWEGVTCHHLALGDAPGSATLRRGSTPELHSLRAGLNAQTASDATETVAVATVDDFCRREGIATVGLLKTDTEGFEMEVLRGAAGMLREERIHAVLVEAGLRPGNPRFVALSAILGELEPKGYGLFALYDLPWKAAPREVEYTNALFVRNAPVDRSLLF